MRGGQNKQAFNCYWPAITDDLILATDKIKQ